LADLGYFQQGESIDYTPASAVSAGPVVVLDTLVTVAARPIPANGPGSFLTRGVVFPPSATGANGAQGSAVRYYATRGIAPASTGVYAGRPPVARAAVDATGYVVSAGVT